jgi:hypothetical protein
MAGRKRTMKRKRAAVGIGVTSAICAIGMLLALPASGHKVRFESSLQLKIDTLNDTQATFSGKIESPKARCEIGRLVNVFHAGVLIATATTDQAGSWTVVGSKPPKGNEVTAVAPKKVLKRNSKHRHKCAASTATRKVTGP